MDKWDANIDNCIIEFQLNATEYIDVIEWIPFDRLHNIQKIEQEDFAVYFQRLGWMEYE